MAECDAYSLPSKVLLRCPLAGGGGDVTVERCFEFDRVLGSEASTEQLFDERMQALAAKVSHGGSTTVMAYGQTGSGKTHTVLGPG